MKYLVDFSGINTDGDWDYEGSREIMCLVEGEEAAETEINKKINKIRETITSDKCGVVFLVQAMLDEAKVWVLLTEEEEEPEFEYYAQNGNYTVAITAEPVLEVGDYVGSEIVRRVWVAI